VGWECELLSWILKATSSGEGDSVAGTSDPVEVRRAHRTGLSPLTFLERSVRVYPDKVAVVQEDRRYTYRGRGSLPSLVI
jgi:hypothetical protein